MTEWKPKFLQPGRKGMFPCKKKSSRKPPPQKTKTGSLFTFWIKLFHGRNSQNYFQIDFQIDIFCQLHFKPQGTLAKKKQPQSSLFGQPVLLGFSFSQIFFKLFYCSWKLILQLVFSETFSSTLFLPVVFTVVQSQTFRCFYHSNKKQVCCKPRTLQSVLRR